MSSSKVCQKKFTYSMCSLWDAFLWILLAYFLITECNCWTTTKRAKKFSKGKAVTKSENPDDETLLTDEDFRHAATLKEDSKNINSSMMYARDKFEGDILMEPGMRSMVGHRRQLWPKATVPFTVSRSFSMRDRAVIAKAMQSFHNATCVRFVPRRPHDKAYLSIQNKGGCYTYLGRTGGKQIVSLNRRGCVHVGIVQHELMHTLGFYHEQSRFDRDKYIKIRSFNIMWGMGGQFAKASRRDMNPLGEEYDVNSIMHYDSMAFSWNGWPTMLKRNGKRIPRANLANSNDMRKINKLYKCFQNKNIVRR